MKRWTVIGMLLAHGAIAAPPTEESPRAVLADPSEAPEVVLDGTVERYVAHAVVTNPSVRVAFARWQAAVHQISPAGTLANPTVDVAVFVRSVETRVGPQQARVSLSQAFPWPTELTARRGAAASEARAAQYAFDAMVRGVSAEVERAYWDLWELRATRSTHVSHLDVVQGLSTTVGARLEVGEATLADLQQVDLSNARLADHIATMASRERMLQAQLGRAAGVTDRADMPTTSEPPPTVSPAASLDELTDLALTHPSLQVALARTEAAQQQTRVARAQRMPGFRVGADWIATGTSEMPGVTESGKDAVAARVGVTVPLWQRAGAERVRSAHSQSSVAASQAEAIRQDLIATLDPVLAQLDDSARRVSLIEGTLLPQAQATYDSLLGSLAVGQGSIVQVLLTQRDLLELTVDTHAARAQHARAWATLHDLTGALDE